MFKLIESLFVCLACGYLAAASECTILEQAESSQELLNVEECFVQNSSEQPTGFELLSKALKLLQQISKKFGFEKFISFFSSKRCRLYDNCVVNKTNLDKCQNSKIKKPKDRLNILCEPSLASDEAYTDLKVDVSRNSVMGGKAWAKSARAESGILVTANKVISYNNNVKLAPKAERQNIYIYTGNGTDRHTFDYFASMFAQSVDLNLYKISPINLDDILRGFLTKSCSLFVMPGGAARIYREDLQTGGNDMIKNYVANGGAYLGTCAGAYYAASSSYFENESEFKHSGLNLSVASAIGPLFHYDYFSFSGARALAICTTIANNKEDEVNLFYNGGPYFEFPKNDFGDNEKVIAWYILESPQDEEEDPLYGHFYQTNNEIIKRPAILKIKYGNGTVILSGLHFEYSPENLKNFYPNDPYINSAIPMLIKTDSKRISFIRNLLNDLGIKTIN